MTYSELDRLSNRVAHGLLLRGERRPLAMVAPLQPASIVAMLGALKAGWVFVPLDPRDPPARLDLVKAHTGALLVSVDELSDLAISRDDDPSCALEPGDPSIVYFTSGSSGGPRGTIKSHRQLTLPVVAYDISEDDRVAWILPLAFAASLTPVFGTLLTGATGCLLDPTTTTMETLADRLAEAGVTVLKSSPSVLHTIASKLAESRRRVPSLRLAIIGGEPSRTDQLELVRRVFPRAAITNHYGSSEAGYIAATTVRPGEPLDAGATLFKQTFPWQTVEIHDAAGRVVPAGEPGEIVVAGDSLSLGYWDEPREEEQRFFVGADGMRRVKTGDRGRLRLDGALEYLGRNDLRVKVHGQMVDPQTVENALAELPGVRQAIVSTVAGPDGDIRLVAHLTCAGDEPVSRRDLRVDLSERLPPFAVPSVFCLIDAIPRTERGKVDREALRQAALAAITAPREGSAPRNENERALAEIVAGVLEVPEVGATDDIFELGADSLTTSELLIAIEERLAVALDPADLVEAPTVEALALRLLRSEPRDSVARALRRTPPGTPFFCVPGGGSVAVELLPLARHLQRPVYALVARGFESRAFPDRRVERAAARYVAAVRSIQARGPYFIGGHSFGGIVAWEMARQLQAAGEPVGLLVLLDPVYAPSAGRNRKTRPAIEGNGSAAQGPSRLIDGVRFRIRTASAGIVRRPFESQAPVFWDLARLMAYRYRLEPYDGPALLLHTRGREDLPAMAPLLTGETCVADTPGDHATMLREPHAATLALALEQAFADREARRAGLATGRLGRSH
jgi:acyl-coenzyme A synthetase/AMP-(fatty) acid ligase/thioesterase domain-containing protein/acyl carrier protein